MDPTTIISGGLSAVGNIFGSIFGTNNNNKQAELNRQFQREMWDAQNAYNTPAAQIGRLEDAGLNPALVYGNLTTGNSQSLPSGAQGSSAQNPDTSALFDAVVQSKQLKMAEKLNDSQVNKNNAEAEAARANADTNKQSLFNAFRQFQLDFGQRLRQYSDIDKPLGQSTIDKVKAETANLRQQTDNLSVSKQLTQAQISKTYQDITNTIRQLDQFDKQLQIEAKNAETNAYNAKTNRINAVTNRYAVKVQETLGLLNWSTNNTAQELRNVGQRLENQFNQMTLEDRVATCKVTLQNLQEQYKLAVKQNKTYYIRFINEQINLVVDSFTKATQAYKNWTSGVRDIISSIPVVGKLVNH